MRVQQIRLEALDLYLAIGAGAVADGKVHDLHVLLGGAEEEIEVAEGIELAEVAAAGGEPFVVNAPEDLGAAEGVLVGLAEDEAERQAEEFVGIEIQQPHGLALHGARQETADLIETLVLFDAAQALAQRLARRQQVAPRAAW